jgi:hypothetical protein
MEARDMDGIVIEVLDTAWDEPVMLVSRYRVFVMDEGRPSREREPVRYCCGVWMGSGFRAGTDNRPPESMDKIPLKRPRGKKTWRDGEWR